MKYEDAHRIVLAGGVGFSESVALDALSVLVKEGEIEWPRTMLQSWAHDPQKTAAVLNSSSYVASRIFADTFDSEPKVLLEWLALNTRQRVDLVIRVHINWLNLDQAVAERYGAVSVEKFGKRISVPGLYEKWGYVRNDVFEDANPAVYEFVEAVLNGDPNAAKLSKVLTRNNVISATELIIKHGSYSNVSYLTTLWEGKFSSNSQKVPQDVLLVLKAYRDHWVEFSEPNSGVERPAQAWVNSVYSLIAFLENRTGDTLSSSQVSQVAQAVGYPTWFTVNDLATLPVRMQPTKVGVNPDVDAQFFGGVLDETCVQHEDAMVSHYLLEYLASIGCQVTLPGVEAILGRSDIGPDAWSGFSLSYAEVSQHLMDMLADPDYSEKVIAMQRVYANVLIPQISPGAVTAAPLWGQIVEFAKVHPERGSAILAVLHFTPIEMKNKVGARLLALDSLFFIRIWQACLAQARKEYGPIGQNRIQAAARQIERLSQMPEFQLVHSFLDGTLQELHPKDFAFGYYNQTVIFEAASQYILDKTGDPNEIRYEYNLPGHPIVRVIKSLVNNGLDPQEILRNLPCDCVVMNPELEEELMQNLAPNWAKPYGDYCAYQLFAHLAAQGKLPWQKANMDHLVAALGARMSEELPNAEQQIFLIDNLHHWEGSLDDLIGTAAVL